jgi:hypothetical protein
MKIWLSLLLFCGLAMADVPWMELKPFNGHTQSGWASAITDIMQHEAPGDSNNYDDLITMGHETSHGIHAYLRNTYASAQRVNAFYALQNRAVLIPEPNFRKSQVAQFIPRSLRGDRYQLYIVGQTEWDDTPLYVYDEWNAYVNGGEVGVSQVEAGKWNEEWQDGVAGQLEFNVYAIAVAMAAKQYDPSYLENVAFKSFIAFNLERSMNVYRRGAVMPAFKWTQQDAYLVSLQTGSDASDLRAFSQAYFGADWCKRVLGF